jgi:vacuolar-type H+-ATPase catalytic subunit A/Vma1
MNEQQGTDGEGSAKRSEARSGRRRKESDMASTGSNGSHAPERFADAYRQLVQALQEAWDDEELRRRVGEAYQAYARAAQEAQTVPPDALQNVTSAYGDVLRTMGEASSPFEAQQRAAEPYRRLVETLTEAASSSDDRLRSARSELTKTWQEAPATLAERADKAYQEYLDQIKGACSEIDESVSPEALGAIGQSLSAAAAVRAASLQAIGQARMAAAAMAAQG